LVEGFEPRTTIVVNFFDDQRRIKSVRTCAERSAELGTKMGTEQPSPLGVAAGLSSMYNRTLVLRTALSLALSCLGYTYGYRSNREREKRLGTSRSADALVFVL
jgi:hypothetical protein